MRIGVILVALTGLALAAYLIFDIGFASVFSVIAAVGWGGFALLCLYGAAMFALLGTGWFLLIPPGAKPNLPTYVWGRAVRDCAGEVLPFSQVGGMVIAARAIMLQRVSGPLAFSSTVVDITVEMVAQIVFVLSGLAILVTHVRLAGATDELAKGVAIGLSLMALGAALFVILQRRSFAAIVRNMARLLPEAAGQAKAVHRNFIAIYDSPLRLAAAFAIHLSGWFATVLWAWLAIRMIGRHLSLSSVLGIEAILCGIRSAAVVVPAALGVQEAAYAFLGPLFGLAAPAALAISLLKRARDIAISIPILLAWQAQEGGHALKASRDAAKMLVDE